MNDLALKPKYQQEKAKIFQKILKLTHGVPLLECEHLLRFAGVAVIFIARVLVLISHFESKQAKTLFCPKVMLKFVQKNCKSFPMVTLGSCREFLRFLENFKVDNSIN